MGMFKAPANIPDGGAPMLDRWKDVCERIVPKWIPWRVEQRERWVELEFGTRSFVLVKAYGDNEVRYAVSINRMDQLVSDQLTAWLRAMRDKCNEELGEKHVPHHEFRRMTIELEHYKRRFGE